MKLPELNDRDKDRITCIIIGLMVLFLVSGIQSCIHKKECIKRNNCQTLGIK